MNKKDLPLFIAETLKMAKQYAEAYYHKHKLKYIPPHMSSSNAHLALDRMQYRQIYFVGPTMPPVQLRELLAYNQCSLFFFEEIHQLP